MNTFSTVERYGYAANGTIATVNIYFDDEKIIFKYESLIDTFLILFSMIPIVSIFIEVINYSRRLFSVINHFFKRIETIVNEEEGGFEFFRINYNQIIELKINEKTVFHSWFLHHFSYLPLVNLFILSLGSCVVIVKYKEKNKIKKKKIIFSSISLLNKFKVSIHKNPTIKKVVHNKMDNWKDLFLLPLNISCAIGILYLILLAIFQNKINVNILIIFIIPFVVNTYISIIENFHMN